MILSLAALPLSALAGTAVRDHSLAMAVEQATDRRPTVATLLEDPAGATLRPGGAATTAPVAWTTPEGVEGYATVEVSRTARQGDEVTVWTTADGDLATHPLTSSQASARSAAAVVGVLLTSMLLVWITFLGVRSAVDKRRYHAWDDEWASIRRLYEV